MIIHSKRVVFIKIFKAMAKTLEVVMEVMKMVNLPNKLNNLNVKRR